MNKKKFRYAILKEIEKGNTEFTEKDFGVDENFFDDNIRFLHREGYIEDISYYDDRPDLDCTNLTEKGENFLEENSSLSRLYRGIKEIKSFIPGL